MLIYISCKYAEKSSFQLGILRGERNSVPTEINSCSASESSLGQISSLSMKTEDAFFDFTRLQKLRKLSTKIFCFDFGVPGHLPCLALAWMGLLFS